MNWLKFVAKGAGLFLDGADAKKAWNWARSVMGGKKGILGFEPVRDRSGVLQSTHEGIMEAYTEHYKSLAQDPDPQDQEYWQRTCSRGHEQKPLIET